MKALDFLLAAGLAAAAGWVFFVAWQMLEPLGFGFGAVGAGYAVAAVAGVASVRLFTVAILGAAS